MVAEELHAFHADEASEHHSKGPCRAGHGVLPWSVAQTMNRITFLNIFYSFLFSDIHLVMMLINFEKGTI